MRRSFYRGGAARQPRLAFPDAVHPDAVPHLVRDPVPPQRARDHARHVAQGKTAKRAGASLEHHLSVAHQHYHAQRVGVISKLHPEVRGNPRDSHGLYYAGPGDCDYVGWIANRVGSPVPVAFDAKHTSAASMEMPSRPAAARTLTHQIGHLLAFAHAPEARAFLLVVDDDLGRAWFLCAPALKRLLAGERVLLRAKVRGSTDLVHYHPSFALSTVPEMGAGAPWVDWRRGLLDAGLL